MPRDEWKKANDRARFGPLRLREKKRRKKRGKHARIPPNFHKQLDSLFVVHAGTPITVIRPDGSLVKMQARKNLRFGNESDDHSEEGCRTFKRYEHYLIVRQELVGIQPRGPP